MLDTVDRGYYGEGPGFGLRTFVEQAPASEIGADQALVKGCAIDQSAVRTKQRDRPARSVIDEREQLGKKSRRSVPKTIPAKLPLGRSSRRLSAIDQSPAGSALNGPLL